MGDSPIGPPEAVTKGSDIGVVLEAQPETECELTSAESWDMANATRARDAIYSEYREAANAISRIIQAALQRSGIECDDPREWDLDIQDGRVLLTRKNGD